LWALISSLFKQWNFNHQDAVEFRLFSLAIRPMVLPEVRSLSSLSHAFAIHSRKFLLRTLNSEWSLLKLQIHCCSPDRKRAPSSWDMCALAMRGLYVLAGVVATQAPQREQESSDYGACRIELYGRAVVFLISKITPTKIGQFVTLWKRPMPSDEIAPLDSDDGVDLVVVSVADTTQRGQFVFNKHALLKHSAMSRNGHGGKRGIRVYPPWTKPVAKDAIKTQRGNCSPSLGWRRRMPVLLNGCAN
jgi:hypothetical protein